jgi:hypothetical protein
MAGNVKTTPKMRYHCVTVTPCSNACADAIAIKNVRLLSAEAPRLPLAGCTKPAECRCKFQHHEDRRDGPRRSDVSRIGQDWTTHDRRRSRGRRATDFHDD